MRPASAANRCQHERDWSSQTGQKCLPSATAGAAMAPTAAMRVRAILPSIIAFVEVVEFFDVKGEYVRRSVCECMGRAR